MSGFEKPNFTQVPNALFTAMADMGESELKVVLCAVRLIFGYHKVKPEAISYSQFETMTGMKRPSVVKGVKAAIKRGIMRIAGKGSRGVNLYEIVIKDENDQLKKETSDQLTDLTSQGATSKEKKLVTSKKFEHTKESNKEKEPIADGKVIAMPQATDGQVLEKKPRSAKQVHNDQLVEALGKALGIEAVGTDYGLYAKIGNTLEKAGIPMAEFGQYVTRLQRTAKKQGWDITVRSLAGNGRPSEYVAARNNHQQNQEKSTTLRQVEYAEGIDLMLSWLDESKPA